MHITSGDVVFEGNTLDELRIQVQERFPKWSNDVIDRWVSKAEKKEQEFIPDTSWVIHKFEEFNRTLFGGKLWGCVCDTVTNMDDAYGAFSFEKEVRFSCSDRRMFVYHGNSVVYLNSTNINLAKPKIVINIDYSGAEENFENTLIHEMCHFYTYLNGIAPKQGHGKEFRDIARLVFERSNGKYKVGTYATDIETQSYRKSDGLKKREEKKLNNKLKKSFALFIIKNNGNIELTLTTSQKLVFNILDYEKNADRLAVEAYVSSDADLITNLYHLGYNTFVKTHRFYTLTDSSIVNELETKYDATKIAINNNIKENTLIEKIISDNIDRFLMEEFGIDDDVVIIAPGENLSIESPFEREIG